MTTPQNRLLSGVRIIDLTSVIMGPYATHILADLGADVIKVEPPTGDTARQHPPLGAPGITGAFLNLNRNKRSVVLDLKSEAGKRALDKLLETADVIVHNLRAPVMKRLGFDYEHCRTIKPDIVYCAAYGFGADGPYGPKPAYDDLIQAASGFAALSIPITDEASYAPSVIFDKISGLAISNAILAGLFDGQRTGEGQEIEVPMFETAIEFNLMETFAGAAFEPALGKPGYARIQVRERKPYRTADGFACIMPYSDKNWQDFFAFIGRDDLIDDPRFLFLGERSAHFPFLYGLVEEAAPRHTTEEWVSFCDEANIPCMPVIDLAEIGSDPHIQAVKLFETVEHPHAGKYHSIRRPSSYSAADFELRYHAPLLGEHSREVLIEAGLPEREIDEAIGPERQSASGATA